MGDVDDLLAKLKTHAASESPRPHDATRSTPPSLPLHQPQPQLANYGRPLALWPATAPPSDAPRSQPLNRALSASFNTTSSTNMQSSDRPASERTNDLLNLLKFNNAAPTQSIQTQPAAAARDAPSSRTISTSELMASLSGKPASSLTQGEASHFPSDLAAASESRSTISKTAPAENPQDTLLKLLNRPQVSSSQAQPAAIAGGALPSGTESGKQTPVGLTQSTTKTPVFTYVNPFDQLAASTSNNNVKIEDQPGKITPSVEDATYLSARHDTARDAVSPEPSPLPDGRTRIEALIGIGASKPGGETVADALQDVGEQADREARDALARAEDEEAKKRAESGDEDVEAIQEKLREAAVAIKEEMKEEDTKTAVLVENMPGPMAKAFEETIEAIAQDPTGDSWESADAEEGLAKETDESLLRVYQFPMRPWVSIDIKGTKEPYAGVRDDVVMKIANLKREFDQVDRTLTAATSHFIVYAMSKGGGFRVVRQDDGSNKHVFKKSGTQIFNLNIAGGRSQDAEPILATGVNGTVYWTSVPVSSAEAFDSEDLDSRGFSFPPLPSQEDNTSGAQLKTRAKLSSRHPEFFAVGRGKSIHIVWPQVASSSHYMDSKTRIVNSEKYLSERCLKIATGKAGKDFVFSEDDTIVLSLDKAGRLKFWDISGHTDSKNATLRAGFSRHVEAKVPIMTLATSIPTEKSWATSVHFVDKERPTVRGSALRYLLVGSKQNHTIQLWDIGLGKPVQELNFPHGNETDAICSIAYHSKSGIIAVGHPTRNSVYFIHLSTPRYNLPHMSQVQYIERLANKDKALPKPESTAIMSGMREISLSNVGQLRSLAVNSLTPAPGDQDEETALELYLMHSQGVTCLNLKRQDIGVGKDGKPLHPMDAVSSDLVVMKELRFPTSTAEGSEQGEPSSKTDEPVKREKSDASQSSGPQRTPQTGASEHTPPRAQPTLRTAVVDAYRGRDAAFGEASGDTALESNTLVTRSSPKLASFAEVAQRAATSKSLETSHEGQTLGPISAATSDTAPTVLESASHARPSISTEAVLQALPTLREEPSGEGFATMLGDTISNAVGNTFTYVLTEQLDNVYRRFDDDKRVQAAAGDAKQDAMLRLVSSTLTENVEKSLSRIVASSIQQSVVPAVADIAAKAVDRRVSDALGEQLQATFPRELQMALPAAIDRAMQDPELLNIISDLVSSRVATHVEGVFASILRDSIAPAFQQMAIDSAQKMAGTVEASVRDEVQHVSLQNQTVGAQIDQLISVTSELLDSVSTLSRTQATLEDQVSKLQAQLSPTQSTSEPPKDSELHQIADLMAQGRHEDGTIKWLQSARQTEIFEKLFVQVNPAYLRGCSQIVTLSVSAAVTAALDTNTAERLNWLEVALSSIDVRSPEITGHAAGVMDALTQRLQEAYMQIAEENPSSQLLPKIHVLVRQAKALKSMAG